MLLLGAVRDVQVNRQFRNADLPETPLQPVTASGKDVYTVNARCISARCRNSDVSLCCATSRYEVNS
jgi:hypothetical protein